MRRALAVFLCASAALASLSCRDTRTNGTVPTAPILKPGTRSNSITPGTCTTLSALHALTDAVFGAGSPNANSVHGKLNNLQHDLDVGDFAAAKAQAFNITDFVLKKYKQGGLPGTKADVVSLVNGVFCYAGLSISITDPANSSLINPTDSAQTITSSTGTSGTQLPTGAVTQPAVLEFVPLADGSLLDTKLDKYPGFVAVTMTSENGSALAHSAVVAVCPPPGIPTSVRARLRLGHQASTGFELTPPADGSFIQCPTSSAALDRAPGWLRRLASLVLPKTLYARQEPAFSGGVGGTAGEFSPFGTVDPELSFSGGVGGTAGEFKKSPTPKTLAPPAASATRVPAANLRLSGPGSLLNTVQNGVCTAVAAPWSTEVEPECRPEMTITTHLGTKLQGVPVAWTIGLGGGTAAPEVSFQGSCDLTAGFGPTTATTTDANGRARICWMMGPLAGTNNNTVVARPSAGGDAPAGVTFVPAAETFTASALKRTPTATATGGSFVFDGLPHPGSGACSDGLTPALSYDGDGSVPTNKGTRTLTVSCGDGEVQYITVTAAATITIAEAIPTVTVTCTPVVFNGADQSPCTAKATGVGGADLGPVAVVYAPTPPHDVGSYTATANFASAGNYGAASGSGTFQITKAPTVTTVNCPASVVFNGSAQAPCTASVTGPALSQALTVTYSNNVNVGTATANASYGGGANWLPSSGSATFQITPAPTVTTASCPASVVYDSSAQTPCSATATGPALSQAVAVSYSNNVNAGTATASASYAGGTNWLPSSGSATFQITKAATATTVSCPVSVLYTGSPQTPCSAAVTGAGGLNQAVTPVTYTSNVVGTATASATYGGGTNWLSSTGSAPFQIFYVQSSCFASPIYSVMPSTKSFQNKGSNVPVKCTLLTASGTAVSNATGDLLVQDRGTDGSVIPGSMAFSGSNVFKQDRNKNYAYGLDTSPSTFISGHYYFVTAFWNDGSKTTGWFYIK